MSKNIRPAFALITFNSLLITVVVLWKCDMFIIAKCTGKSMSTVLIIEDEANIRTFISANLEARGYTVLDADTGTAGLNLLYQHTPSALVLDLLLPDMQGWDVLDVMCASPELSAIPVILMSAVVNMPVPGNKAYPNVAVRLPKPSSAETLIAAVERVTNAGV
jgi:CheY-like chemotaxis protein